MYDLSRFIAARDINEEIPCDIDTIPHLCSHCAHIPMLSTSHWEGGEQRDRHCAANKSWQASASAFANPLPWETQNSRVTVKDAVSHSTCTYPKCHSIHVFIPVGQWANSVLRWKKKYFHRSGNSGSSSPSENNIYDQLDSHLSFPPPSLARLIVYLSRQLFWLQPRFHQSSLRISHKFSLICGRWSRYLIYHSWVYQDAVKEEII